MTQEEKDLLLKDLCARLSYGVKCQYSYIQYICIESLIHITKNGICNLNGHIKDICDIKPYLFPLTEEILDKATEESNTLYKELISIDSDLYKENNKTNILLLHAQLKSSVIKYFHIHHIDYNGLIGKGLAIDATGLNIY
jgi:hypothetical protein